MPASHKEAFVISPVPRHPRSAGGEGVRFFVGKGRFKSGGGYRNVPRLTSWLRSLAVVTARPSQPVVKSAVTSSLKRVVAGSSPVRSNIFEGL